MLYFVLGAGRRGVMKFTSRLILAVCLLPQAAHAQETTKANELRALLQAVQAKLDALQVEEGLDQRVKTLGSKPKVETPFRALVVRIYDVSDLFVVAPPYPAEKESDLVAARTPFFPVTQGSQSGVGGFGGGGFGGGGFGGGGFGGGGFGGGGMGGGAFNVASELATLPRPKLETLHQFGDASGAGIAEGMVAARVSLDDLIDTIQHTIAAESWAEVGGEGAISRIGSSLIISATEDTHAQIASLLKSFRERWGSLRTVSVTARWLWLGHAELAELLDDTGAYGLVKPDAWQQLHELPPPDDRSAAGYSATITCQNGQTVHATSASQTLRVTNLVPVIASDAVAYQPQPALVEAGAALQVTPIANRSGKFVTLDVHSRVTRWREAERAFDPDRGEVAAVVAAINRGQIEAQRLSTTLRVPVEKPMLVGGMTFASPPDPAAPILYLFVTVSVQELRDDLDQDTAGTDDALPK